MLAWSLRFVDDFAEDILVATEFWRLRRRTKPAPRTRTPREETQQKLREFLDEHITRRQPLPDPVRELAMEIEGFPRHLGIHSGGMVICDRPVSEVVPVEQARMNDRTVLQWDKDDCATTGLVKFDLLGLGMLSAIHYAVDLVDEHEHRRVDLTHLDLADQAVYDMLCEARRTQ